MITEPDQIRARVAELLAELPDLAGEPTGAFPHGGDAAGDEDSVIDDVARRLEQAHEVLVEALESVEKD